MTSQQKLDEESFKSVLLKPEITCQQTTRIGITFKQKVLEAFCT